MSAAVYTLAALAFLWALDLAGVPFVGAVLTAYLVACVALAPLGAAVLYTATREARK